MNEVALRANDVLRNDVMLRINEVALRANGIVAVLVQVPEKYLFHNLSIHYKNLGAPLICRGFLLL